MCTMIGQFPPLIEPRDVQNILPITFSQYVSKLGNLFSLLGFMARGK